MRRIMLAAAGMLVLACAKQEQAPVDTAAAAPPPPALSLADLAGSWTYVAKSETGDTVLVTAELTGTADAAGWTIVLPGRQAIPLTVSVSGDSVMTSAAPYESVLRKGVTVSTEAVLRLSEGKLVGKSVAHYSVKTADSVRHLIIEATRK